MILKTGLPALPHVPARNPESVYFRADEALYSEPPLYFYYQALFYVILPPLYGTARLSSAVIGLGVLWLVFALARRWGCTASAALWAAGLFAFSRWFLFPATSSRPDILCTFFGLLGLLMLKRWDEAGKRSWLMFAGLCIGLGGLAHPFALVYAVQMAAWVAWSSRGSRRIVNPVLLASVSIAVAALWIPLILIYPDTFRVQFRNQYFHEAGGSLLQRMVFPWESLWYHSFFEHGMVNHIGPWQTLLVIAPLAWWTLQTLRGKDRSLASVCWLAWSSIYLLCVIVGPHHPVIGYWSYSAALFFIVTGRFEDDAIRSCSHWNLIPRHTAQAAIVGTILLAMIPGSGLRSTAVYVTKSYDINFNEPRFARELIASLPPNAVCAVDTQLVLDFVASGRPVYLAATNPAYFRVDQFEFEYLLVSRAGLDSQIAKQLPVELLSTRGLRRDPFSCYVEVYRRTPK